MFRFVVISILAALSAISASQQPSFRSGVQTVVIHSTVKDENGRLVPGLTQDQFEVLDNGQPAQITAFSNEAQPITVALMLDMSGSMMTQVFRVRDSTLHFIEALQPADRARIGTFGSEIALSPLLTNDKRVLARVAREELWPGGGTPLWNALYAAMGSLYEEQGRRVVLVLTDGMNSGSLPGWSGSFGEVRARATKEGYMLYSIGMEGVYQGESELKKYLQLIDDTGGGHFNVGADDDLQATFARVADELRRQYLIGFAPVTLDGKEHSLEVRLKKPGLKARARKSYVAGQTR